MNYVNVKILPTPYNIEFKCVGKLIFDINYVELEFTMFIPIAWLNSKEQFHRENGLAVIWNKGDYVWYRYGKLHRENGPAASWGAKELSWWLNGIEYSEEDFNKETRRIYELRKRKLLTETT